MESRSLPREGGIATLSWGLNCRIKRILPLALREWPGFNPVLRTRPQTGQVLLCPVLPQASRGEIVELEGMEAFCTSYFISGVFKCIAWDWEVQGCFFMAC